ncbi:aldehyde dehydrogenase family protein (plasmid) [Mycobacterium sp. TJFP1]
MSSLDTNQNHLDSNVVEFISRPKQMFVDGEWVNALSGDTFDTLDPATANVITSVPRSDTQDVERAITAARRAFDTGPWPRMTPAERQRILWRIGEGILAHADTLAQLECIDNGKSVAVARSVDVVWAAEIFFYYAGWATKLEGRTVPVSVPWATDARFHAFTIREPVGVCAQIVPWNFPLVMAAFKLAPALACGNTVVLKPAEQTPLTALLLAGIIADADVPAGVVNVLTGFGDAGAALAAHPDVDKVAFTGSTEVGKKIVHAAAGNLKKVSLELGGKSPQIVFADADFGTAIPGVSNGFLFNHGQTCTAGTRLLIEDRIFDEFTAGVAEFASSLKIGPGLDPTNDIGPLVSEEQLTKVTDYLQAGLHQGARALAGGSRHGDSGFYVEPTLLVDVKPGFTVYQEEIFGPVAVAVPFNRDSGIREAANDTPFGLAASIWTRDVSTVHKTVAQIKAGTVWVNCHNAFDAALPFGGYKQSGWGRELGEGAIDEYTQTKSVNIAL